MAEKGDRTRDIVNPALIGRSRPTERRVQRDATKVIVFREIHRHGEAHGANKDWYTRAETYALHLLTGQPYGGITISEEIRRLVRGFLGEACKVTGFVPPAPQPKKAKKRRKK